MKQYLAISLFALAFAVQANDVTTIASQKNTTDISGVYICTGHDPFNNFNNHYKSKTTIKKTNQTYQFIWQDPLGRFIGTGVTAAGQSDFVAAYFANVNKPNHVGVVIYKILDNGDLSGTWTLKDKNSIGEEICKKTP